MAWEIPVLDVTFEAAEDLSDYQFHFVVLDATSGKVRLPDSATEYPIGILQNETAESGQAAVVRIQGISKLVVNDALAIFALVSPEYVGATDGGKGSTGILSTARGMLLEASAAEDDVVTCLLVDMPSTLDSLVKSSATSLVLSHVTSSAH